MRAATMAMHSDASAHGLDDKSLGRPSECMALITAATCPCGKERTILNGLFPSRARHPNQLRHGVHGARHAEHQGKPSAIWKGWPRCDA